MARVRLVRGRWSELWRRVDVAINQREILKWGSLGFAGAIVLTREQETRSAAAPSGAGFD
jgi:hypothetical protein